MYLCAIKKNCKDFQKEMYLNFQKIMWNSWKTINIKENELK